MKNISMLIALCLLVLPTCAPSEGAVQTAIAETQALFTDTPLPTDTLVPTSTETASPTPDMVREYFREFLPHIQKWGDELNHIEQLNRSIAGKGPSTGPEYFTEFENELSATLGGLGIAAENAAEVKPPSEDLQKFQDWAEELQAHTQTYVNSYIPALTGDQAALDLANASLENASEIYARITEEIKEGNYTP